MDERIVDQFTGAELKPGDPEACQGNGQHEGFECCCDECDYYLECNPERAQHLQEHEKSKEEDQLISDERAKELFWWWTIEKKFGYDKRGWRDNLTPEERAIVEHFDAFENGTAHLEEHELVEEPWMSICAFKCKRCGDVLRREYKSPNDYGGGMLTCSCGHLSLDPNPRYYRVFGEDVENLCKIGGYEPVEV